jgi:hypothetical protein
MVYPPFEYSTFGVRVDAIAEEAAEITEELGVA